MLTVGDALVTIEAENTNPDWMNKFDTEGGAFIRGRIVRIAEIQAIECLSVDRYETFGGELEWLSAEWRVTLRDGTRIEPPRQKGSAQIDAVSDFMTNVVAKLR